MGEGILCRKCNACNSMQCIALGVVVLGTCHRSVPLILEACVTRVVSGDISPDSVRLRVHMFRRMSLTELKMGTRTIRKLLSNICRSIRRGGETEL